MYDQRCVYNMYCNTRTFPLPYKQYNLPLARKLLYISDTILEFHTRMVYAFEQRKAFLGY